MDFSVQIFNVFFRQFWEMEGNMNWLRCIIHKFDTCACNSCKKICLLHSKDLVKIHQEKCEVYLRNESKAEEAKHNLNEKYLKCKVFGSEVHKQYKTEAIHTCPICHSYFESDDSLLKHALAHFEEQPEDCDMCKQSFTTPSELRRHIVQMHSTPRMETKEEHSYKCTVCKKGFRYVNNLAFHLRAHKKRELYECTLCTKKYMSQYQMLLHKELVHANHKHFECAVCNRKYLDRRRYKMHLISYSRIIISECEVCNRQYVSTKHSIEMKRNHNYECTACNEVFLYKHNFKAHAYHIHAKSKNECPVCNCCFRNQLGLRLHMGVHTNKTSTQCFVCQERFSSSINLESHMIRHYHMSYECNVCKEELQSKESVMNHMLSRHAKRLCVHSVEDLV